MDILTKNQKKILGTKNTVKEIKNTLAGSSANWTQLRI